MNVAQSIPSMWRSKTRKLIILLVVVCLGLIAYLVYSNRSTTTATDKSIVKTSNPSSANAAQNDLLPVTTTPGVPDTSGVNSPGNSGQNIQSQPDSTPKTSSPQQAAPATPDQVNEPVTSGPAQPTTTPTQPSCGACGGGGYRKAAIVCPMYCAE